MKHIFKGKNFTAIFTDGNGYFSLTGDVSGASGAVGQSLVEIDPDFLPLELLHLCDVGTGAPMHAWANAEYYFSLKKYDAAASSLHLDLDLELKIVTEEKKLFGEWLIAMESGDKARIEEAKAEIAHIWEERIFDLDDDLETLADTYAPENRPEFVEPVDVDGNILSCYAEIDTDDLDRMTALARFLDCNISEIEPASYGDNIFEAEGKEFAVLTDAEADELWDRDLENYIDECLEIPENMKNYFDHEAWKRDAKMDGRGHSLGRYDGEENEERGIDDTFFIYRQ